MQSQVERKGSVDAHDSGTLGVVDAARAIRTGDLTAEAYAQSLLDRARDKSDINAFITVDEQAVLAAARDADKARAKGEAGYLLGVPLGVKDSYMTRGLRTTLGVGNLRDYVPTEDAQVVSAVKAAGAIVFGKNNLVEMSYGLTGGNGAFGQVKNPHASTHVSGGSSSGSAAAVAAGIVPAAFGGDTVGSIRVPAALCGVVGFKPTTGRWPRGKVAPISHVLDTTGVFARNVEDCLLIDQVVTGEGGEDGGQTDGLRGVRLAIAPKQYLDLLDPDVEQRFDEALRRIRDAGADVVEIDLGDDFASLADKTTWNIFFRETMTSIAAFLQDNDIPVSFEDILRELNPGLKGVWEHYVVSTGAGWLSAGDYAETLDLGRPRLQNVFKDAFANSGAEALIFPTVPCTAPEIGKEYQFTIAGTEVSFTALAKNTVPASGAGLPGLTLPIGTGRNRLPVGLELDAPFGADRQLLALARRVERLGVSVA
ncbi:amidase family protein [Mesorhizobium sp. 2RAF21]|uniref:amidase family protein n=1 Tax=Mesorhizobium sp. 2RAF21 TaxID=3232995 RepID=UPI003F9BC213